MRLAVLVVGLALGACQNLGYHTEGLGAGATLVLHAPLTIPPERASLYLQDGYTTTNANPRYPNCRFEVKSLDPRARTVEPDTFIVRDVRHEQRESTTGGGTEFVGGITVGTDHVAVSVGDSMDYVTYATVMRLHSPRQPEVLALTCQQWQDPIDARFLTLEEMRRALGSRFTLRSPDAP